MICEMIVCAVGAVSRIASVVALGWVAREGGCLRLAVVVRRLSVVPRKYPKQCVHDGTNGELLLLCDEFVDHDIRQALGRMLAEA